MQVLAIPCFNALLLGIQVHEFILMISTRACYLGVDEMLLNASLESRNDVVIITKPKACENTRLYDSEFSRFQYFFTNDSDSYQANHYYLENAYNLSLSTVVIMTVGFVGICYLSFRTYRDYGWSIYRINGADIQKRNVLMRYHVFMLALKLNIYFAICDAFPYLFHTAHQLAVFPDMVMEGLKADAEDFKRGGYSTAILVVVSTGWCLLSAALFFFVGVHAIRKCNYWLMGLLLVVYLVQVFIEGRYCLYLLVVKVPGLHRPAYHIYIYWGVIVAIEMAFDIFIVLMGCWVTYDFKNGLSQLVNDMYENKPWILFKKPEHLQPKKERFIID